MADINIKAGISLDTGDAKQGLATVQTQLEKTGKAVKDVDENAKSSTGSFGKLRESLTNFSPAAKKASEGISVFNETMKANPILAVVGLIIKIVAYFILFQDKIEKVIPPIKLLTDAIKSVINFFTDLVGITSKAERALEKYADTVKSANKDLENQIKILSALGDKEEEIYKLKRKQVENSLEVAKKAHLIKRKLSEEDLQKEQDLLTELAVLDINESNRRIKETDKKQKEKEKEADKAKKENERLSKENAADAKAASSAAKEEAKKNAAEEKLRLQNIFEFNNEIRKLQQERQIAAVKDGYEKEKLVDKIAYADHLAEAEKKLNDKKITQEQYLILTEVIKSNYNAKEKIREEKHAEELAAIDKKNHDAKEAALKRGFENLKKIEEEQIQKDIKARAELIKLNDSEVTLAKAKGIATIEIEHETFNLKRELERANLVAAKASITELQAFDNETATQTLNNEKAILDARAAAHSAFALAVGSVIGSIGAMFEQGTAASKVAAIAEIGLGTATGFIQGLDIAQKSAKATGPGAAFAFPIFYATQVAAILKAVGSAKSALSSVKGGGGVNVSAPSISSVAAPVLPQQTNTNLNAASIQAVGNAAAGGVNRNFVLDADISNSADRAARLNRAARLG